VFSDFLARVRALFRRKGMESELDEELRAHLEHEIAKYEAAGVSPVEAVRRARLALGGLEQTKEQCRDARGISFLETLIYDIRYGLRMLRKSPGFASVAIVTLALGIGANTAMFSVTEGIVFAPLPFSQPDRLVSVWENNPRFPRVWASYPNFLDWQRTAHSFQQIAAFWEQGIDLTAPGTPEHLIGKQISAGFFSTLGTELALGREFSADEDRQGGPAVAIISNRVWRNRFAANPEVLGHSVTLNGVDYSIVGVTQPDFRLVRDADVYVPLGQADPMVLTNRATHAIAAVARLRVEVNTSQAQAEMTALQTGLDQLYAQDDRDIGIFIEPLKQSIVGDVRGTLLLLLGAVGVVLLIACANVANLVLARSTARTREFAVRSALGATRSRLLRQLLTENVLLSLAGAGLGLLIASLGAKSLVAAAPELLPRNEDIHVNASVLLFTLAISITVGILFGLAPALKSWNADPQSSLKEGGRGATGPQHGAQSSLVIVQMALTLILLVSAGLLLRTVRHLWEVNPGFDPQHLITFRIGVSRSLTKTPASTRIAYQQLIERIRQIPGVRAADFTDVVPLSGQGYTLPFWIGGQKPASLQAAPRVAGFLTGPDYRKTMGIPLLRGRFFTIQDTTKSPCVFVIDSVFAQKYFPDSDPLGQTASVGFAPMGPCQIVGVVGHVKLSGLGDPPGPAPQNQLYVSLNQDPDQWVASNYPDTSVIVRTPLELSALLPAIKSAVYATGNDQPVFDAQSMQQIVSASMSDQRFPMILLGSFACLALLLASVGIYGVISYSVTQRVHEIGIRMALGAERQNILRLVLEHGLRLTLVGLTIGAAAALILTRLLSSFSQLLYGVRPSDPATFLFVSLLLAAVAVFACYIPARRAVRVDPMVALRHE
jgi:predicted permease